jgi:hypothetical protein
MFSQVVEASGLTTIDDEAGTAGAGGLDADCAAMVEGTDGAGVVWSAAAGWDWGSAAFAQADARSPAMPKVAIKKVGIVCFMGEAGCL